LANEKEAMENIKKIYILHGWSYTTDKWAPFIGELEKLGCTVKLLHIPGLTSPLEKVWNLDNYVSWLSDTLKMDDTPVTLLGHSNGGRISLSYASRNPDKVAQLILIGSAGVYHKDFFIQAKRNVFGFFAKAGSAFKNIKFIRKVFYRIVGERDYRDANPIMQETMRNLITVDLVPEMSKIKCPTLLIWGENDKSTPLSDGKIMSQKISGSKLAVIKGARHSPQFTHMQDTINIIKDYYGKANI
jgi:pimeloyl-ACP methyl ester carboxylesterase